MHIDRDVICNESARPDPGEEGYTNGVDRWGVHFPLRMFCAVPTELYHCLLQVMAVVKKMPNDLYRIHIMTSDGRFTRFLLDVLPSDVGYYSIRIDSSVLNIEKDINTYRIMATNYVTLCVMQNLDNGGILGVYDMHIYDIDGPYTSINPALYAYLGVIHYHSVAIKIQKRKA